MNCYLCDDDMGNLCGDRMYCYRHKVAVLHQYSPITKELIWIDFFTPLEDNIRYQVLLKIKGNSSEIYKIVRHSTDYYRGQYETFTSIKSFDHIVFITPENAENRIKTILTFS